MILYDKDGKSYNVPHAIDVAEWKKAGYTELNPKSKDEAEAKAAKQEARENKKLEGIF